jgi:probable addiction module antidote protein
MSVEKELDPEHYRDNPTAIANYLSEIIEKNDLEILVRAIGNVMRAQNVKALSEETGLRRENLYRMFAGHRDPSLGNTMKILASCGVQLAVKPRTSIKVKPLRPKLGRPQSDWTPEEDGLLRSMVAAGESATAIATLLKRKAAGVHKRAHLLKIKLARSPPGPKPKRK